MPIAAEKWEERFWRRGVATPGPLPTPCMIWTGWITPYGYGETKYEGRKQAAHRVAYKLTKGDPGDLLVCHACDIRLCINPDHLWAGTQAENMADMARKNRGRKPTLSPERADLVLRLAAEGVPQRLIGECFGVTQTTIHRTIQRLNERRNSS